jgi:sialidase-1
MAHRLRSLSGTLVLFLLTLPLGRLGIGGAIGTAPCTAAEDLPARTLFEDVHAVKLPRTEYGYRSIMGDISVLKDGRLLLAYTRMNPADGSIAGRYSVDKGRTWGDESILVGPPKPKAKDYYCHPTLIRLANGDILLSYIYSAGVPYPSQPLYGHTYYRRSTDDAKTWGDQFILTPYPGWNLIHNDKLIQLKGGRIVAPVTYQVSDRGNDHLGYASYTWYSDDNGRSWRRSKNDINMLPIEADEPHVVELKDGRVMMLMRNYSHLVGRAHSTDGGHSWSKGELVKNLPLPPHETSAINVKRIPSTSDLLLLRCTGGPAERPKRRTPFASVISRDDGRTWVNERVILSDPQDDYGYPCLEFMDDIAIIGCHTRDGLHVLRIGIDWFYGK